MKLHRTINFNFAWLVLVALVDVAFLLVFFLLLSSNFILQQGISLDAAKRRDESIIIKADRATSYETVAEVANAALEHGITSVALAATPPR